MAILLRNQGERWQKVAKIDFMDEAELQQLLYESPELVASSDEGQVAVFTREAGLPGSGRTDLIGVTSKGELLIVESKLARNREIRRTVIGQVVEYAAFLWRMSFEDFDALFVAREGKSVLDLLADKRVELDKEELRKRITENLVSGNFDLLIAVDATNPELDKIIAYLSSRDVGLKFEALEVEAYRQNRIEVLVPHRHGQISVDEGPKGRRNLTIEEMLASCPDEHSRKLLELAVNSWSDLGNHVVPGKVGASFRTYVNDVEQPIFWAYPDSIQGAFSTLERAGAPASALAVYRNEVSKISGFKAAKILKEAQPITRWDNLAEPGVRSFVSWSESFVESWRKAAAANNVPGSDGE